MIDYDYLEWGVGVSKDENKKKMDYKELEGIDFFETDSKEVAYEEKEKESNEYNVWYFENEEQPWGDERERVEFREDAEKKIADFVNSMEPGQECWTWRGGTFLDTFLLETMEKGAETAYDSVLLLAPDNKESCPVAIPWEMVPECKRAIFLNIQRGGGKIFAAFSDRFKFPEEGFICLEIYFKK